MTLPEHSKADCYSSGEQELMLRSQQLRASWLQPLLKLLATWKVQPDHITALSLLAGLLFCVLYFASGSSSSSLLMATALATLALHVILDGLDGPLARFTKTASRRGSFTDTMADQTIVVCSTIALMGPSGAISVAAGAFYIFVYTLVVTFAMVRNAMQVPYSWVVRPRFVVYAWLFVEVYWLPATLNTVVWLCNAVLFWKVLTGFWKIRGELGRTV